MSTRSCLIATALVSAGSIIYASTQNVCQIHRLCETPPAFQRMVHQPRRFTKWGFWTSPLPPSSGPVAVDDLARALFTATPYKLELILTQVEQDPAHFKIEPGNRLGNMLVLLRPSEDQAVFEYKAPPDFDWVLYLGINRVSDEAEIGFVDWSRSTLQHVGERVYTPWLLQAACAKLRNHDANPK
ncbi:hypothetical protein SeMB42_g04552 [Synchytrium endobioticum]|uniref:Uncharacterized protein n=1 Tax=Synchytrium endobioticum TaxID=286115 RepID=A0A507CX95_9FUNG|nr:hypothetical protein SeLEV6574_g07035 [Synchytrium endobioticum]TPX43852.1 hypothetical protein SeMB42_g04552 [Synchytrium endobioticum]